MQQLQHLQHLQQACVELFEMAKCCLDVVSDGEYKLVVAGDASRCGAVAGLRGGVTLGGGALKSDIDAESGTNHTAHTVVKIGRDAIQAFKDSGVRGGGGGVTLVGGSAFAEEDKEICSRPDVNHIRKQPKPPAAGIFFSFQIT
jgi:hypothetical protein